MQFKLLNVITSFTSLYTSVVKLITIQVYAVIYSSVRSITIQVLRSYLQTQLELQTMYNVMYLEVCSGLWYLLHLEL